MGKRKYSPLTSVMSKVEALDIVLSNVNLTKIPRCIDRAGSADTLKKVSKKMEQLRTILSNLAGGTTLGDAEPADAGTQAGKQRGTMQMAGT
jgi:hypothetical protein